MGHLLDDGAGSKIAGGLQRVDTRAAPHSRTGLEGTRPARDQRQDLALGRRLDAIARDPHQDGAMRLGTALSRHAAGKTFITSLDFVPRAACVC